jgi:hypothetical protein
MKFSVIPNEHRNGVAHDRRKTKRVVKNGHSTNQLVLSATLDGNDAIFPKILELYVRPSNVVADITYGKGVFWRNVPPGAYRLKATDIQDGVDCRKLPYKNGELDCVVFDPPYMHTPGGAAHSTHAPFENALSEQRERESDNQQVSRSGSRSLPRRRE